MINCVLMMLGVGGLLGLCLGIASKVLYVEVDHRVEDVTAMLPGYNCGGCGYAGCSGMAAALVKGESKVADCKPSKPGAKDKISEYLAANA